MGRGGHRLARTGGGRAHRALRQRRAERAPRGADDRSGTQRQARPLREAARPHGRRVARDLARGRAGRCRAHVRLQLPLRPRRPPCPRDARGGRPRRPLPLPRALPPVLGSRRAAELALRPRGRGLGRARRPRRPHRRHRPLPGRRAGGRDRRRQDVHRGPRGRRHLRSNRRVRQRRRRDAGGLQARARAGSTTTPSR